MSIRSRVMGWGLKGLNRLAGLPLLDRPEVRHRVARFLYGASRTGFRAAGVANRPFAAARKLAKPLRPAHTRPPDLFDLTPTDEQQMVAETMRRFAAEVLRPAAAAANEACAAPAQLLVQARELGLAALNIPEELGGAAAERPALTNALATEGLGHGDMGLAVACLSAPSVAVALAQYGDGDQQACYLPSLLSENPPQAAIAVMEGQPLFDPFRPSTRLRRDGDGYVLDGEKHLVAGAQQAELFLVAAATDEGSPALFLVESGSTGLSVCAQQAMGLRAAGLGRVTLEGVKLPARARLGGESGADYGEFIARSRLAWSALAVGACQAALDYVIPYANERQAFGEPISQRQAVAFMIADMGIELEGARLALWRAASLAAAGKPFAREAALAKNLSARHGMRAGSNAVQILGGHGFVKEHPVERWYRDLRAVAIMEGGVIL